MIGVEGHWMLNLAINGSPLLIQPTDLIEFTVIEEAGNLLPVWSISFYAQDYTLAKYWNEGAAITCSWGKTRDNLEDAMFVLVNPSMSVQGSERVLYSATGVYDALAYVTTPHVRTLGPIDALSALKTIVSNYFTWSSDNISKSEDKMAYIQPNTSDKKFVDHLAKHTLLRGSYFGTGITALGKFRAVNVKEHLSKDAKFSVGHRSETGPGKPLIMFGPPEFHSNSSLNNALSGYGVDAPMIDTTNGTRIVHRPKPNISLAQANKLPRSVSVERRTKAPVRLNTSHDVNYHVAVNNNYTGLMNLSNESVTLVLDCGYEKIAPWDVIQFSCLAPGAKEVDEIRSGKYVIGLVSRRITGLGGNRFLTRIRAFRESINLIQGDLHE